MLKFTLDKNQNIFFTSDTHYNHKNLVKGVSTWVNKDGCRSFDTISQMNDHIVNNINSKVGQNDILIHNGDWSFGGIESISEFRSRIVCKNIYLFLGNHDDHIAKNENNERDLFTWVGERRLIQVVTHNGKNLKSDKYLFINDHFPMASWLNMRKGVIHLFGHLHLSHSKKLMPGKSMDCGLDGNNYLPYSLQEILKIMENRPIKGLIEFDKHGE